MKKGNLKYWLTGLCLFVLMTVAAVKYNQVNAAGDFVFATNSATYSNGETILLNSTSQQIWIADNTGGIPTSTDVTWELQGIDVLKFKEDTGGVTQPLKRTMERVGPGYATITVTFTVNNITYVKQCNVQIDFDVNQDNLSQTTTNEKSLYFGKDDNTAKIINLKYTNAHLGTVIDNTSASLSWESEDPNVATVNQKGEVTKVGAGKTRIKITTNNTSKLANPLVQYVTVVVSTAGKTGSEADYKYTHVIESSDTVQIITNAKDASKLTWRFYDSSGNLLSDPTKYMSYSLPGDSTISLSKMKAGVYYVVAYIDTDHIPYPLNLDANETSSTPYLKVKITVPPVISGSTVTMSVGDTYSIWNNSNLLEETPITYTTNPLDQNVISISNGIITAEKLGDVEVIVTVNSVTFTITVKVIDYIKLNMSQANVYTSGTVSLIAYTSNNAPIKWESSNPSIATVTGTGNTAVVKALTVGKTTITASQTIDGVVKKATCVIFVQAGVSKITIKPASVTMNIGDETTLQAEIEPAGMSNVDLSWASSDESIVSIATTDSTRAVTIKAKVAGSVIITAINKDNVVVGYSKVTVKQKVTGITLSASNLSLLLSSKTYQLRAIISPDTATNQTVNWKSSNTAVATVNSQGLVTLVSAGTTSIIVTSQDDPSIMAICNITVGQSVTAIKLDETTKTMYVGETARMSYIISPTNATNKEVTWSTTNSAVVSVDANGQVTARGAGIAVLVLRSADGSYMSTCTITVKQKATGIDFDVTDLELNVGQTYTIKVTATPANATDYTLTWTSLDNAIATVDEKGTITGKAVGKTVIMATASTGGVVYCNVTVKAVATGLQLNYSEKNVVIGDSLAIKATIIPSNAASTVNVVWTSSKPSVATISSSGTLKAIKGGTTIITAKTSDGKYTSFCIIHVVEKVTSIKLNKTYYRVGLKKSYTLKATVKTNAATNPKIKWSTSNSKIATVDQKGKVTGRAIGTVTITAAAMDGSGVKATSTIRIVRAATSITLNRTSVTTVVGRTVSLKATVKPSNATFKTVNWTTSNEKVAIVDSNGRVTALSEGTVTIKASAKDNSGKYAICYMVVGKRVPANSVTIINQNLTMVVGEITTVQKAINPTTSTDSYIWQSDNKTVASVDSATGRVTAKTPGIANITIMTESGKMATTKVTVVGLNTTRLTLEQYTNYTLSVVGVTSGVTWDIADSSIAVVRGGFVSTRRVGTTTITAIVNGRRLTCRLTVTKIR
ncbi:MAG: Ig domain-containing protein [Anaerocolumna sp.]